MFVRFVTASLDSDSGRRQGLFQAIAELRDAGELSVYEQQQLDDIYDWFNDNLKVPYQLSRSTRYHAKKVAISWFRDAATAHIARMRQIAGILDAHGIETEMIRTDRPGYVVYEDNFQIAAEPFNDTTS